MRSGIAYALAAAVLFGASTPFAKTLLTQLAPVTLAGVLYFGSGLGLLLWYGVRRLKRAEKEESGGITRRDLPWLFGAIAAGGVAGPVLLMTGLSHTAASTASLLLNMEGVLTALLAWFAFKEHFDYRIFIGMAFIVAAGVLLSWDQQALLGSSWGVAAIVGACLCWGIDNNLTRKISASDAVQIACVKGLVAGAVNHGTALAGAAGRRAGRTDRLLRLWPEPGDVRAGLAPSRHLAHRGLFFGGAVCRRAAVVGIAGRIAGSEFLGRDGPDGHRHLAPSDRAAWARPPP